MGHQPCQRCKYITSVDIQKSSIEKLVTHVESNASSVSLLSRERRIALYERDSTTTTVTDSVKQQAGDFVFYMTSIPFVDS